MQLEIPHLQFKTYVRKTNHDGYVDNGFEL